MKNKIKTSLLVIIFCSFCFGQKSESDESKISTPKPTGNESKIGVLKIYLLGGIVSAVTQKELNFGKKYDIVFHDFGCLAPINLNKYKEQNQIVFDLLNLKFGTKWQSEINLNILGFEDWKLKK